MYKGPLNWRNISLPDSEKLVIEQPPIVDVEIKVVQTSINNQVQPKLIQAEISNDQNPHKVGGDRT